MYSYSDSMCSHIYGNMKYKVCLKELYKLKFFVLYNPRLVKICLLGYNQQQHYDNNVLSKNPTSGYGKFSLWLIGSAMFGATFNLVKNIGVP